MPEPLEHRPGTRCEIALDGVTLGGGTFVVIAGPCAVESREQLMGIATGVAAGGASVLRGGAFKPRTSPYSFQGLGHAGLRLLRDARDAVGLPVVTELLDVRDAEAVAEVADVLQIGARSMHSGHLLREVAWIGKPVLLKRNPGATLDELLAAADYVLAEGNEQVILCERGIRTFAGGTRYTLDLSAVPLLRQRTHLPVIVDPSHAAGRADLVPALAKAAAAVGADGIMVEVHHNPTEALSDGAQSMRLEEFGQFVSGVHAVAEAAGMRLQGRAARSVPVGV